MALTPEEKKEHLREARRKWREKQKQEKALATEPNYKDLYEKLKKEYETLSVRSSELEKLCKSYAENAQYNKQLLQKATMEYSARTEFMLDCVRHAYTSMQLAQSANETKKGE